MSRVELKWVISVAEWRSLRNRLAGVMKPDAHADADGAYEVRSLYFDDLQDSAVHEKLDGLDRRKKMRLRVYDLHDGVIKLEKKTRVGDRTGKEAVLLDREEVRDILAGRISPCRPHTNGLLTELALDMRTRLSRPAAMIDYTREALYLPVHDVRVSCDRHLSLCLGTADLFEPELTRLPVLPEALAILEVKFPRYVPEHLAGILATATRQRMAYSKYVVCRQAGYHHCRRIGAEQAP